MKNYAFILILLSSLYLWACQESRPTSKRVQDLSFSSTNFRDSTQTDVVMEANFKLNQENYLSAHIHLDKPLIHTLRQLDSSLSDDALLAQGNFSIEFHIDDQHIFTKDLHPGAGLPQAKMEALSHRVPLVYPEQIDYWGWYMWKEFYYVRGGKKALTVGEHELKMSVKAYLNSDSLRYSGPLSIGRLTIAVDPIEVPEHQIAVQAITPLKDWEISKEEYGVDQIREMNKKIAQKKYEDLTSIVIIKNNALLVEEYFNGADRSSLHNTRSVGKTIASTSLGVAIDEGHIKDEFTTLADYYDLKQFENYSPQKENISLKSLLTMSSGLLGDDDDYDSPGNEENMYPTDDWVKFTLDLPVDSSRQMGEDYLYFTAGVVVLGDIIHKSVPGGLVSYVDNRLFKPMNISDYQWQFTPQNVGNTAGGLQMRSIDYAKYGQLYKNNGKWNGQQLVSENWIQKSMSKQVAQPYGPKFHYGYLLWNKEYTVQGKTYEVYFCSGNGGNKIFIFKDLPVVMVVTAQAYNMPYAHPQVDELMEKYLIPAVLHP